MITGRSIAGILHFLNKSLIDSHSKKQATIEIDIYISEYYFDKTSIKQIFDLRTILHYLGSPMKKNIFMFRDNKCIIDSLMTPYAKIYKIYVALSFHRVWKAIIAKIVEYYFINREINPSDILSKY